MATKEHSKSVKKFEKNYNRWMEGFQEGVGEASSSSPIAKILHTLTPTALNIMFPGMGAGMGVLQKTLFKTALSELTGKLTGVNKDSITYDGKGKMFWKKSLDDINKGLKDAVGDRIAGNLLQNLAGSFTEKTYEKVTKKDIDSYYKNQKTPYDRLQAMSDFSGEPPIKEGDFKWGETREDFIENFKSNPKFRNEFLFGEGSNSFIDNLPFQGKVKDRITDNLYQIKGEALAKDGSPSTFKWNDRTKILLDNLFPKGDIISHNSKSWSNTSQWQGQKPTTYVFRNGRLVPLYDLEGEQNYLQGDSYGMV